MLFRVIPGSRPPTGECWTPGTHGVPRGRARWRPTARLPASAKTTEVGWLRWGLPNARPSQLWSVPNVAGVRHRNDGRDPAHPAPQPEQPGEAAAAKRCAYAHADRLAV